MFLKRLFLRSVLVLGLTLFFNQIYASDNGDIVVLLHGLARSDSSFIKMEEALKQTGYRTCNISYPSTKYPIEKLVSHFVLPDIKKCIKGETVDVNFVTHSMGGILVRYIATQKINFKIGRVVMLSPPNKGSEVVDKLGGLWLFKVINGPSGLQLSTNEQSMPNMLGDASFELGIITGNKSINLILSTLIDGKDDGKVSIESAKLEGMKDFIVLEATHPFIMKNDNAIKQTKYFLKNATFFRD